MKMLMMSRPGTMRPLALLTLGAMTLPLVVAGCGSPQSGSQGPQGSQAPMMPPPGMNNRPMNAPRAQTGMSTRNKVVLLAGAAALYYIYKKRQNAAQQGPQGKYFLSKNGRVYYRDLKTGQFQYVSPPRQPIQVPAEEAQQYSGYQGYNNGQGGQGFGGYGSGSKSYQDAVPAEY